MATRAFKLTGRLKPVRVNPNLSSKVTDTPVTHDDPALTLPVGPSYSDGTPPVALMGELGNTLSRARRARGITLEDVERDTHVSRRYLQALENEDFSIFPAPVYARGFLRTYARYLGLNPDDLVRAFPSSGNEPKTNIKTMPVMGRSASSMFDMSWLVAGLVALFVLGGGLLFIQSRDNGISPPPVMAANQDVSTFAGGQVQAPPITVGSGPVQGRAIGPIRPGEYPEFTGADLASALAILRDNDMNYVIVEVLNEHIAKGLVIRQYPGSGAEAKPESAITLVVSRGPSSPSTTTSQAR